MKKYFFYSLFLFFLLPVRSDSIGAGKNKLDSLINIAKNTTGSSKAVLYQKVAKTYYKKQDYLKAYEYFKQSLNYAISENDSLLIAKSNNNIAVILDVTGDYSKAAKYYRKALYYFRALSDNYHEGCVLNNLGVIYEEMSEPNSALESYKSALHLKIETNDTVSIAATLNNIGSIYLNLLNNNDSALFYFYKSLAMYRSINDESKISLCLSNIGNFFLNKNMPDSALLYFSKSYRYFKTIGDKTGTGKNLYFIGNVYQQKGMYKKAIHYYDTALVDAKKIHLINLKANVLYSQSKVYEILGDSSKALTKLQEYLKLNKKLFDNEKAKLISEYKNSISIDKKNREIVFLKKQKEINDLKYKRLRLLVIIIIITFTLTIIIAYMFFKMKKQKDEDDLIKLRSQFIRSQMSPHFIFNSLMGIETILMKGKVEQAMNYIVDFAQLVRNIMLLSQKSLVKLDDEIKSIKQYLSLEKMRFADKFDYRIEINTEQPIDILEIPPMLLQPFLENAILHGFFTLKTKGMLLLKVFQKDNNIKIIIEDNGIGREKAKIINNKKTHKSLAINLTKKRLALLRKRLKLKIKLDIIDLLDENGQASGTKVILSYKF